MRRDLGEFSLAEAQKYAQVTSRKAKVREIRADHSLREYSAGGPRRISSGKIPKILWRGTPYFVPSHWGEKYSFPVGFFSFKWSGFRKSSAERMASLLACIMLELFQEPPSIATEPL